MLRKNLLPVNSSGLKPGLILTSALIVIQMWLFIWAPLNGRTLELSLGYFMLPLVMVPVGRIFFGEKLCLFQWLAVVSAILGVGAAYWNAGGVHVNRWPSVVPGSFFDFGLSKSDDNRSCR